MTDCLWLGSHSGSHQPLQRSRCEEWVGTKMAPRHPRTVVDHSPLSEMRKGVCFHQGAAQRCHSPCLRSPSWCHCLYLFPWASSNPVSTAATSQISSRRDPKECFMVEIPWSCHSHFLCLIWYSRSFWKHFSCGSLSITLSSPFSLVFPLPDLFLSNLSLPS